jgi:uncharacterized protein (TIGR02145 family)
MMKKNNLIFCFLLIAGIMSAQDYKVGFIATGLTTEIDSVEIKNLNQNKQITIYGADTLHLVDILSSYTETQVNTELSLYPNPSNGETHLEMYSPELGLAVIIVSDLSGKQILKKQVEISSGNNRWKISGFDRGTYLLSIQQADKQYSRILQVESAGENKLHVENQTASEANITTKSVNINNLIEWQYNEGDILLFKGWSYGRSRIVVYSINSNVNLNFNIINCQDAEGHQYTVTTINDETWMAENLKTCRYINNSPIPNLQDTEDWNNTTEGARCYSNNDSIGFANNYGPLYNFAAVNSGNLCPNGWHIPSSEEFQNMIIYLENNGYNYDGSVDSDNDASTNNFVAKALCEDYSFSSSTEPGTPGNNDYPAYKNRSGFSALAAGERTVANDFEYSVNHTGNYWTSTTNGPSNYKFSVNWQSEYANIFFGSPVEGYSVRCIKD